MCACCDCTQLRKALDSDTPLDRCALTSYALMVYCRDGVLAPPSLMRRMMQVKQERACDRAFGLQTVYCVVSVADAHPLYCRELLLSLQPSLRVVTTRHVLALLDNSPELYSRAADVGVESVASHYAAGISTSLQPTLELIRGLMQHILLLAVPKMLTDSVAVEDVWSLQVSVVRRLRLNCVWL